MARLSIYITDEDYEWLKELKLYAKENRWSLSLAIRELLKYYFEFQKQIKQTPQEIIPSRPSPQIEEPKKEEKISPEEFFAKIESKMVGGPQQTDEATKIEAWVNHCDRRTNNSCYFFDNGKDYYWYCKQWCWTRADIWKERVRP